MKKLHSFRRGLSVVCAVVVLLTSLATLSVSVSSAETAYITHNGQQVSSVTLPQDGKLRLQVTSSAAVDGYSWQIRDPQGEDAWVAISGTQSSTLWVTYALVGSMLEQDGTAQVRCRLTAGETTLYTDPVTVTLSFSTQTNQPAGSVSTAPTTTKKPTTLKLSAAKKAAAANNAALALMALDDEEEYITHSIVINYLFDNNALAFEPYGATVAHGSDFKDTIKSPVVVGYAPFRRVGENYVDATEVTLDYTNIQEDIVINVVYEPALVDFSVHHHLQNLLDDDYSIHADRITTSQAVTGTLVGDGLALTEEQLPGFRALAYEKLTVAADGSTVIEIRYDRNYYLVDFDMNGGYGTEPVYTRYGATVGVNEPIRHGYLFDGWELVSYDGRTPTAEEASRYTITTGSTITVPDANLRYRARWITQETTYTMVFWRENADDNGYSYWGYLDGLTAMSGSLVSGQDWADRVTDIDDADYFTFNAQRTDKDVLVEGDGSTVVNVYYTRNYYTLTIKAPGLCTIPEGHTHTEDCYDEICGLGHTHTEDCESRLTCTIPEHTAHTAACVICGKEEHVHGGVGCDCTMAEHSHVVACWGTNVGDAATSPWGAPSSPQNGQVFRTWNRKYYIYLKGSWYTYSSQGASSGDIVDPVCGYTEHTHGTDCTCDQTEHAHTDACYRDTLHIHTDACYLYSCGQVDHTHTDACYRLSCGIPTGHTHSSTCNRSSNTNTVKTVYRKYGQSLADTWPVKDDNGKVYDSGERWSPSSSSYYSQVLVYISKMPPDDFTLTLSTANYDTFVMNYYLQVLPGQDYDVTKDGKQYALDNTIAANYNYITYDEDFFEIAGFDRYDSDPDFSNGQLDINGGGTVNFYYDRGEKSLTFSNNGIMLDDKAVTDVQFEAPLKEYYFEPEYPATLEPGAYTFDGWYTSPGCFAGTEVDWDTITMEEDGLQLFASWVPITHRVRVFKDATLTEQIGEDQIVDHKAFAYAPHGTVENGNYVFQGWFYMDTVGGELVEKAFVFNGIPILEDMDVYAKWSSHVSVEYRINYVLKTTGEPIADPTEGMAIAGHNKTFEAKAGADLYKDFQTGFYPLVNSHTITMSVDGTHEFTFEYVYVESVPYTVRYVSAETGEELLPAKTVKDNTLSVVTEVFERVSGMMPDAYQKRLVLVADGTDADGDGVLDQNVITFYYHTDEVRAYYRTVHYIRNITGDGYREYRSEETVGNIGETYTVEALTLTGFAFNGALTEVNDVVTPVTGDSVIATLPAEGMLIELYYDRITVPYTVRYLDSLTREEIYPSKTGNGVFGEQVPEYAPDLTGIGYDLVGNDVRLLTLSANPDHNVFEFLYQERVISLKYQLVGPVDGASLSRQSENVLAISGQPNGSTPTVKTGFAFLGWYTDEACTLPVDAALVDATTGRFVPVKEGDVWQSATYYAKVVALETDLTIRTRNTDPQDGPQAFLFRIVGKAGTDTAGIDLTVTVMDNGETTVADLPTGDYTVTRLTDWSWRYGNTDKTRDLTLAYSEEGTTLTYDNARVQGKWLDGNAVSTNDFNN